MCACVRVCGARQSVWCTVQLPDLRAGHVRRVEPHHEPHWLDRCQHLLPLSERATFAACIVHGVAPVDVVAELQPIVPRSAWVDTSVHVELSSACCAHRMSSVYKKPKSGKKQKNKASYGFIYPYRQRRSLHMAETSELAGREKGHPQEYASSRVQSYPGHSLVFCTCTRFSTETPARFAFRANVCNSANVVNRWSTIRACTGVCQAGSGVLVQ